MKHDNRRDRTQSEPVLIDAQDTASREPRLMPPAQHCRLPHTVLHVPHDRLRVTSLRELPTSNGVAFTANLRLDRKQVGVIEDTGRGGGPLFSPYPDTGFGFTELNAFAAACRHHGEPVSTERLLSDLVTEYDLARQLRRATARGGTLLRLIHHDWGVRSIAALRSVPGAPAARRAVALEVSPADDGSRWDIWNGQAWEPLIADTTT